MTKVSILSSRDGLSLDTLAQLGTKPDDGPLTLTPSLGDQPALIKRARRKYLSTGIVLGLVNAAKTSESKLSRAYWNSYHCARSLTLRSDGAISGHYCKNRWCLVCNAIRTARLINQYGPILSSWEDPHMVTLTLRSMPACELKSAVHGMQINFRRCYERLKKQAQRNVTDRFKGLRKLECTYNPQRNDFHPHFHVIVEGKLNAKRLREYWMENAPGLNQYVSPKAQDILPADAGARLELFKYFTKIISGKSEPGEKRLIYADALDQIFNAVSGMRTFQTFGLTNADRNLIGSGTIEVTADDVFALAEYQWDQESTDWVNMSTGEALTGYAPGEGMRDLVKNDIRVRAGHNWSSNGKRI